MTVNQKKLFMEQLEQISDKLDKFLDGSYSIQKTEHPGRFLHRWMIYNDRRLNLLIEIVKTLIKEGKKKMSGTS